MCKSRKRRKSEENEAAQFVPKLGNCKKSYKYQDLGGKKTFKYFLTILDLG